MWTTEKHLIAGQISLEDANERLSAGEPVYVQMRYQRCRVANIDLHCTMPRARIVLTNQWVENPILFTTKSAEG